VWLKEAQRIDVVADGQKYARSSYFNIKFGVLEIIRYIIWYSTEERGLQKSSEHKKYMSEKKIPLSPQVHTADIPRDLRTHMDKSA
jgi:hypothetical protein